MNIDPNIAKFTTWALGFLFSGILALLVWTYKQLLIRIEVIAKNQESELINRASTAKDIEAIKTSILVINSEMKELSSIKEKIIRIESDERHILESISSMKSQLDSNNMRLNQQEKILYELKKNKQDA